MFWRNFPLCTYFVCPLCTSFYSELRLLSYRKPWVKVKLILKAVTRIREMPLKIKAVSVVKIQLICIKVTLFHCYALFIDSDKISVI